MLTYYIFIYYISVLFCFRRKATTLFLKQIFKIQYLTMLIIYTITRLLHAMLRILSSKLFSYCEQEREKCNIFRYRLTRLIQKKKQQDMLADIYHTIDIAAAPVYPFTHY